MFGPTKAANGPAVREASAALLARFPDRPPASGQAVLDAFEAICADLAR